jgi:PLD-like domain
VKAKLLTRNIWPKITSAAASGSASANAAVAYFGAGGSTLLPLREGSRLVVDFSERAVKSGQTNPSEIAKLIQNGVDVYNKPNLHAKVFVFRNRAFIGSTNVSNTSAFGLQEAAMETRDKKLVASMRRFVHGLCHDLVTLHEAISMKAIYNPPRFGRGGAKSPRASKGFANVTVVQLEHMSFDREVRHAERRGEEIARKRLKNSRYFQVDDFLIRGRCRFKLRDMVVQVTDEGKAKKMVSPQAKVIHLETVPKPRKNETIVFLELSKKYRRKSLKHLTALIGPKAKTMLTKDAVIRNQSFIAKLLAVWTGADN